MVVGKDFLVDRVCQFGLEVSQVLRRRCECVCHEQQNRIVFDINIRMVRYIRPALSPQLLRLARTVQ